MKASQSVCQVTGSHRAARHSVLGGQRGGAGSPWCERRAEVEPARIPCARQGPQPRAVPLPGASCSLSQLNLAPSSCGGDSLLMALRLTSPCLAPAVGTGPGLARQRCREHPWRGVAPALPLCRGGPRGKRLLGVFVGSRYRPWEGPKG